MNTIGINKRNDIIKISEDIINRHMVVTGKSGVGKSTFVMSQLLQYAEAGEKIITFNWHNCLNHDLMIQNQKEQYENYAKVFNVAKEGIKLPLFDPIVQPDGSIESDNTVIQRVTSLLSMAAGLTPSQEQEAFSCVKDVFKKELYFTNGIKALEDWLGVQKKATAKAVAAKIRPLTSENLIRNGNFFDDDARIYEFDLTGLEYDSQIKVLKFMLEYLQRMANKNLFINREIMVFVDEASNLDFSKGSTMYNILGETRKMGLNMTVAFPSMFSGNRKDMGVVTQCATSVYFEPLDKDRRKIAELIDSSEEDSWVFSLASLKRGEFIVKSQLECNGRVIDNPMTLKTII